MREEGLSKLIFRGLGARSGFYLINSTIVFNVYDKFNVICQEAFID